MKIKIDSLTDFKMLTAIHLEKHPLSGKTFYTKKYIKHPYIKEISKIPIIIIDYYDRISLNSWRRNILKDSLCLVYFLRTKTSWYLQDDEVILVKLMYEGEETFILLHEVEIDEWL